MKDVEISPDKQIHEIYSKNVSCTTDIISYKDCFTQCIEIEKNLTSIGIQSEIIKICDVETNTPHIETCNFETQFNYCPTKNDAITSIDNDFYETITKSVSINTINNFENISRMSISTQTINEIDIRNDNFTQTDENLIEQENTCAANNENEKLENRSSKESSPSASGFSFFGIPRIGSYLFPNLFSESIVVAATGIFISYLICLLKKFFHKLKKFICILCCY